MKSKIQTDPDFVALKRVDFSLEKLLEKYPDGVPEKIIAQALLMSEEEVADIEAGAILKLREHLKVD